MPDNNWGELVAIAEALNLARLRLGVLDYNIGEVHLFTDSKAGLDNVAIESKKKHWLDILIKPVREFILKHSASSHNTGGPMLCSTIYPRSST